MPERTRVQGQNPLHIIPILFTPNEMQRCRCAAKHDIEGAMTLAAVALTIGQSWCMAGAQGTLTRAVEGQISPTLPVFSQL